MINLKEAVALTNNIVNPSDAEQLKNYIYQLQQENLELKSQLVECKSKLNVFEEWTNTKSLYKEHQTEHGAVVYIKIKETIPNIFYCPVCFDKKSIIPLQPVPEYLARTLHLFDISVHKYCPACKQVLSI